MPNGVETYKNQIRQKIQEYLDTLCKAWGDAIKSHQITYAVTVYASRIIYSILTIQDVCQCVQCKDQRRQRRSEAYRDICIAAGAGTGDGGDQG